MKLILKLKGEDWVNTESGDVSYSLHSALKKIFLSTGNREFRFEDDKVFIIESPKSTSNKSIVVDYGVVGETYEGE
jgi:hypothetical protein|tara:strand:+ start:308 stop:535 length:228 start_codon:yes stop_codon:yes gene_type:complete